MRVDMTLICQRTERRLFPIKAAMLRLPQKAGVIVGSYDRCVENIDSDVEQKKQRKTWMQWDRAEQRGGRMPRRDPRAIETAVTWEGTAVTLDSAVV